MKKGWQIKRLGDVCTVDKCHGIHKYLPYVGLEHIESHTGRFIGSLDPLAVKSTTFKFTPEHVLYGRLRPYLNKVMIPDFVGHCSSEIFPLKPSTALSREFLQYWFLREATVEEIDATSTGARMPRANMNAVLGFQFPLPPLPEQQRIVGLLDAAFAGIATAKANAEKNLQNARALFASHLQSVFSQPGQRWKEKSVGEILQLKYGKPLDESDRKPNGRFPVYGANGEKDRTDKFYHDKPSIIVGRKGSAGEINVSENKFWPLDVTYFVTFDEQEHDLYFLYYLLTLLDLPRLAKGIKPGINRNEVYSQTAKVPPLPEQKRIVAKLDSLAAETQRLESIYQRKLDALDELKKSLLHQAFTGEL